jgi:hypothetical protein
VVADRFQENPDASTIEAIDQLPGIQYNEPFFPHAGILLVQ